MRLEQWRNDNKQRKPGERPTSMPRYPQRISCEVSRNLTRTPRWEACF
jgi:hypothetical protein